VDDCLREHTATLSPACREKRTAADARFRALVERFSGACRRDVDRLCSEVKPGHGRVIACLLRQQDDLSSRCRAETDRIQEASEMLKSLRATCAEEVRQLCAGVPPEAGALVECLQTSRTGLSEKCRSVDPQAARAAAEILDALEGLSAEERSQQALQILQGVESIAFSRSQVLFQVDHYQGFGGVANANRLLFNPQIAFGEQRQFALQLRAPLLSIYPYAPDRQAQTGLGAITTAFAWAFAGSTRVRQYVGLGFNWISPVEPPVGGGWAVTPAYAISIGIVRGLAVSGQVTWTRSFASRGYPEVNLLLVDPIVILSLPGRTFLTIESKLGWSFADGSFAPLLKGIAGIYIDRRKSLSISSWYQAALTSEAEAQAFKFSVGTALAYFFDW
jgi:hypothetical protein